MNMRINGNVRQPEIMILSTSGQVYRSKSINHRLASKGNDSITAPVKVTVDREKKNESLFQSIERHVELYRPVIKLRFEQVRGNDIQ